MATRGRMLTRLFGRRRLIAGVALGAALAVGVSVAAPAAAPAQALSGSGFNAANIISDVVMYAKGTMSASSIQAFLTAKLPHCDAGFTCLKDYHQDTSNYDVPKGTTYTQGVCAPYKGAKNESAATIIYKVSQDCGVNPQVILVTLEKEQNFILNPDPTSLTYRKAMGYGCPDTAACSSDFYGFFKQVFWGARAMVRPVSNYKPGVPRAIQYSPKASCGTKTVDIANKATANLYTYTPYTPNKASLAAIGTTTIVNCGSYGNRNFWYYFSIWFGSTTLPQTDLAFVQATYQDLLGRAPSTTEEYTQAKYLVSHSSRPSFAIRVMSSTEYRTKLVTQLYSAIYGSAPSSSTVSTAVKDLAKGTVKQDQLVPWIMSTSQFNTAIGGLTPWVAALYQFSLGRVPTATEFATAREATLDESRVKVGEGIWHSAEANDREAGVIYTTYLGRPGTPTELSSLASYLATHTLADAIARVTGTTEYLQDAMTRYPIPSA